MRLYARYLHFFFSSEEKRNVVIKHWSNIFVSDEENINSLRREIYEAFKKDGENMISFARRTGLHSEEVYIPVMDTKLFVPRIEGQKNLSSLKTQCH